MSETPHSEVKEEEEDEQTKAEAKSDGTSAKSETTTSSGFQTRLADFLRDLKAALPGKDKKSNFPNIPDAESMEGQVKLFPEFTLQAVADYIREGRAENIICMTGAGISTCKLTKK